MAELQATAKKFGLPMGNRKMTYNSRLAQELGLWTASLGNKQGSEFHNEVFRAYFVRGENIAQKSVLLDIVETAGLDRSTAEKVLDTRLFSDAVDSDWDLSRAKGVTAAPTFFMGLGRLGGAQSYEILEGMVLKSVGAEKNGK